MKRIVQLMVCLLGLIALQVSGADGKRRVTVTFDDHDVYEPSPFAPGKGDIIIFGDAARYYLNQPGVQNLGTGGGVPYVVLRSWEHQETLNPESETPTVETQRVQTISINDGQSDESRVVYGKIEHTEGQLYVPNSIVQSTYEGRGVIDVLGDVAARNPEAFARTFVNFAESIFNTGAAAEIRRSLREGELEKDRVYQNHINSMATSRAAFVRESRKQSTIANGTLAESFSTHYEIVEALKSHGASVADARAAADVMNHPLSVRHYSNLEEEQAEDLIQNIKKEVDNNNHDAIVEKAERYLYGVEQVDHERVPFNDDFIYQPEKVNPKLGDSPFTESPFKSDKFSDAGQLVRRTANRYQAYWGKSEALDGISPEVAALFAAGAAMVREADFRFANGLAEGLSYLDVANSIVGRALVGVGNGFVQNTIDTYNGLASLGKGLQAFYNADTYDKFNMAVGLMFALPKVGSAILVDFTDKIATASTGSAFERGEVLGQVSFDILTGFIGKGISKGVKHVPGLVEKSKWGEKLKGAVDDALVRLNESDTQLSIQDKIKNLPTSVKEGLSSLGSRQQKVSLVDAYYTAQASSFENVRKQSAEIALAIAEHGNHRASESALRAVRSTMKPGSQARYMKNAQDVKSYLDVYDKVESGLSKFDPGAASPVVGYSVRLINNNYAKPQYSKNPNIVFNPHPGTAPARNRFGVGGNDGRVTVSSGFGVSKNQATETALKEYASYNKSLSKLSGEQLKDRVYQEATGYEIKMTNFRVLNLTDGQTVNNLGLDPSDLTLPRADDLSYRTTNILSEVAAKHGYKGILAPSAVDKSGGKVLHKFFGRSQ